MCIRDRNRPFGLPRSHSHLFEKAEKGFPGCRVKNREGKACLLYTSDAADERSSVDLGGRRIIKKKKKIDLHRSDVTNKEHSSR